MNEFNDLVTLLEMFLGKPKNPFDGKCFQLQFSCPRCVEEHGESDKHKYNLEISLNSQIFNCWKCSSMHDEMHGSIFKLIKLYGNDEILLKYKSKLNEILNSDLYKLNISNDFLIKEENKNILQLPENYHYIRENSKYCVEPLNYMKNRGISMDIINKYKIGYTSYSSDSKMLSNRIILPSYNEFGILNYWTGRDYTNSKWKTKYFNPKVDRKQIIFNEKNINWNSDITIVEGPFDSIVFPNMIPLLGKKINQDFLLFKKLHEKAKGNINIFLDGDAYNDAKKLIKQLDTGDLYGRIRFTPTINNMDPSEIFKEYGNKGIIDCIKNSYKIKEVFYL